MASCRVFPGSWRQVCQMLHQEALDAEKEARMGKVKAEYAHESLYSALVRAEQRKEVVEKQMQSAVAFLMKTKREKTALQEQVDSLLMASRCGGDEDIGVQQRGVEQQTRQSWGK
eukprot:933545-Rhodomonas_salina.1